MSVPTILQTFGNQLQRRVKRIFDSRILRRLLAQPVAWVALTYLVLLVGGAVFAAQLTTHDPLKQNLLATLQAPSADYWFGTDHLGRDAFSRIIFGARSSLFAALQATSIAVLLGVPLGLLSGYFGGWLDRLVSLFVDTLYALPLLLVAMGLIAVIGSGLTNAMFAVGIALSTSYIRLTRGIVLAEREELYIESARIGGISTASILFRHLLPNLWPVLVIQTALTLGVVILIESSLSFLGLGLPVGQPSWGQMLSDSRVYVRVQPWLPLPPGLAITFTGLAFNLLGDALRDALATGDQKPPRRRKRTGATQPSPTATPDPNALLSVRGLEVRFRVATGMTRSTIGAQQDYALLQDVSFDIYPGETFGLVGESGSGKSMTASALLGMLPQAGVLSAGQVLFQGQESSRLSEREWGHIRGKEIGMIFQEPQSALNPVLRIGQQIAEPMQIHLGLDYAAAQARVLDLLQQVGMPDPERVYRSYAHQLSGGMAQRAVIARALSCNPRLLIADEPTTALDVTTQAQILDLLQALQARYGMAIMLISHDLGVIGRMCRRTAVMYAGEIVEQGPTEALFSQPQHPYTLSLLQTMPQNHTPGVLLPTIKGHVPPLHSLPQGCHFHPRCRFADDACRHGAIAMQALADGRESRCTHIDRLTDTIYTEDTDHVAH